MRFLVFGGKTGWIGQKMVILLRDQGKEVFIAETRLENIEQVAAEIDAIKPTHVFNCAGLTGRPNVDWCEDHKDEVMRVNLIGTMGLLDSCEKRGIHVTNFATGCIYTYDEKHPVGGTPFTESDPPNYVGSFYSLTKGMVDVLSPNYKNALTLRLRMPISDDLSPRNFLTKISSYARIINVPNSVTVLHDLLPVSVIMAERKLTGLFNFTNPGVISHNQCLDLYKEYIDSSFWYENFTEEEQAKVLKAGRCNNHLDVTKLQAALPDVKIPEVMESMKGVYSRMRDNLKAEGNYPPPPRKAPKS
jgi:dTDP-4-dehydrorhamnose reductase